MGEFDIPRYRILAGPEVVGSYILWSVWLVLSLAPVLPRDAMLRLPDPADVPLVASPREDLGNGSDRIMTTDPLSDADHSSVESCQFLESIFNKLALRSPLRCGTINGQNKSDLLFQYVVGILQ